MQILELRSALLFGVSIALSVTTLAAMHWYPWNRGTAPLARTTAYAMGTSIVVGFPVIAILIASALGLQYSQLVWAALLVANTAVSGATVKTAYWIDSAKAITLDEAHPEGSRHVNTGH